MIGSGFGALAGGAISENLGGSYELGANIGNIVGGAVYGKITAMKAPNSNSGKQTIHHSILTDHNQVKKLSIM